MARCPTRQDQIDGLEEEFHNAVSELEAALAFAHSDDSEPDTIGAFGKAVTIARRMIAADDKLRELGEQHEQPCDGR